MTEELQKIIELLLKTSIQDLDNQNKDDARKKIIQLQKLVNTKLSETSKTEFDSEIIETYIQQYIDHILYGTKEPHNCEEVETKRSSKKSKSYISKYLLTQDIPTTSTKVGKLIYKDLLRSNTIAELKRNLKIFKELLVLEKEIQEEKELNAWLCGKLSGYEFGDINLDYDETERLYDILEQEDKELDIAIKSKRLKKEFQLTEREIAEVLSIPKTSLRRIIHKFDIK